MLKESVWCYCDKSTCRHVKSAFLSLKDSDYMTSRRSSNRRPSRSPITHSSNTSSFKNLEDSKEDCEYNLFVLSSSSTSPLYSTISVNGCPIIKEVDTGAAFSIISQETYKGLFPSSVLQKSTKIYHWMKNQKLCCHNTHRGLIRYNRLPFGVSSDIGIFQ